MGESVKLTLREFDVDFFYEKVFFLMDFLWLLFFGGDLREFNGLNIELLICDGLF
jgi:hypothetical protein